MSKRLLILGFCFVILIGSLLACGESSTASNSNTGSPSSSSSSANVTPTPTKALKWTTTQTFSGNGTQKTAIFTVPGDWKIAWSCTSAVDGTGIDGELNIGIFDNQNNPVDDLLETCKYGKTTSGVSEEHQGGQVYLSIDGSVPWKVQIQELK